MAANSSDTLVCHAFIQRAVRRIDHLLASSGYGRFQDACLDGIAFLRMNGTSFLFRSEFFVQIISLNRQIQTDRQMSFDVLH
jgi:hypothetical protein